MEHFAKVVNGYNYFRKSLLFRNIGFSPSVLYEKKYSIMKFLNTGLIFTPEVYVPCKKVYESRVLGGMNFYIYTLYNSEFVYRQIYTKTIHLHLTFVFPIM